MNKEEILKLFEGNENKLERLLKLNEDEFEAFLLLDEKKILKHNELDQELRRTKSAINRLDTNKDRFVREYQRRRTMLSKHQKNVEEAKNMNLSGEKYLFSVEEVYSTAPELKIMISNPNRGMMS